MWGELLTATVVATKVEKREKKCYLLSQNLATLDIIYGTIGIRKDLAEEIVKRRNQEDEGWSYWYEEG